MAVMHATVIKNSDRLGVYLCTAPGVYGVDVEITPSSLRGYPNVHVKGTPTAICKFLAGANGDLYPYGEMIMDGQQVLF